MVVIKIKKLNIITKVISQSKEEILLLAGLFFILFATLRISFTAFLYLFGLMLCGIAVFLLKFPGKRGG